MSGDCEHFEAALPKAAQFATTHWSVVLTAGKGGSAEADTAMEILCRTYWYPLYAYVRRRGFGPQDAEDMIQGFFGQLLGRHAFRDRTPKRGKFRSFLLASLNYYVADLYDREHAAKRGGGHPDLALDALQAEERYRFEPVDRLTPEKIFERRWALTLLGNVLGRIQEEFSGGDRAELFRRLRPFLFEKHPEANYDSVATSLGMSTGTVRVAAHRMRQRCRELFRAEVAQTVSDPAEVEEESRYLRSVMAS
jgi:DNA-directed RNA polymerase specialized sigma24 family protein